jgi:hypothetical protein
VAILVDRRVRGAAGLVALVVTIPGRAAAVVRAVRAMIVRGGGDRLGGGTPAAEVLAADQRGRRGGG